MQVLWETYQRLLKEKVPSYQRRFYDDFKLPQPVVGVIGARGVGKTTFLLEYLRRTFPNSSQGLYVSADHLYFNEHTLLDLVDQFVKDYDGQLVCIDEIHKYKNWNQELKNIADSYPQLKVIFSGSSSIDLVKGKYDLSRRVFLESMYGFSFREFLEVKTGQSFPKLDFESLVHEREKWSQAMMATPKLLGWLKAYWQQGYYPTFTQVPDLKAYQQSLLNIVDKIIFEDMSTFYSLKTSNLDSIKKLIYFFATMQPGSLNINRLAQSLAKDHTTIAGYIQMLRDSGLIRFLLIDKYGHALVRNAEKMYLDNPNLLYAINDTIGKQSKIGLVREIFVVSSLQNAGHSVCYTKAGDIQIDDSILEIGGSSKDDRQFSNQTKAFIVADETLVAGPKLIPLYLFGFLS